MAKKILVNYIGKSGGGPAFALEFAKGLAKNGYEVYAIVSEFVDNRDKWEKCDSLKEVYYVRTNKKRGKKYYYAAQLHFMLIGKHRIKKHFSDIQFDYVITTMQHLWSLDISKVLNTKKIVWICHDPIPHSGSSRMDEYLGNHFAKLADETIVLTRQFIDVVHERWAIPESNIHFMPHGRQNMYNEFESNGSLYCDKKFNFLFFGYLRDYKGIRVLAQAFRKLNSADYSDKITLTIAGSGDFSKYKDDFSGLENIRIFNEYIPDNEVGKYFNGPNIVTVMPYLDATQSGVSLTAMEFGSLIIASDTGGLKEQLDNGNIGIYCKPGDVDSLYDAMKRVVDNNDIFESEKLKMKNYIHNLEWENVTQKLMNDI